MKALACSVLLLAAVCSPAAHRPYDIRYGSYWAGCTSFGLTPAVNYGSGTKEIVFTTYDGKRGMPLLEKVGSGSQLALVGSGEFKPSKTTLGAYLADYLVYDRPDTNQPAALVEYGSIMLTFTNLTDSNSNNLPSVADGPEGYTGFTVGIIMPDFVARGRERATRDNYTIGFQRDPGMPFGSYSMDIFEGGVIGGTYWVRDTVGDFRYARGDRKNFFDMFLPSPHGLGEMDTFYTVMDDLPKIKPGQMFFPGLDKPIRLSNFNLARSGNQFWGTITTSDTNPQTRWGDFQNFVVWFTDPNDIDGDGLPGLVDLLPPYIYMQPPSSLQVNQGATATLKVGVEGVKPLTYQWQFNNSDIEGATSKMLRIQNFTSEKSGNYRCRVTNPGGNVFSLPSSLSLRL